VKRKTTFRIIIAILLLGVAGRFTWIALPPVNSEDKAQSPDKRYVAKVSSKWRGDFWGRTPHEYHCVLVETADGRTVRRIFTDEPWTGWPRQCSIQWATNSSSVTITFKTEEAVKTRLILDIGP
jgi:hypothetical protein